MLRRTKVLGSQQTLFVGDENLWLKTVDLVIELLAAEQRAVARERHGDAVQPDAGDGAVMRQ